MNRAPSRGYFIYRTKRADGTFHPRLRFRYPGPDGKMVYQTGYTDRNETEKLARRLFLQADEIRRGLRNPPTSAESEGRKPIAELVEAYLAWGEMQGGRGGGPWAARHHKLQKSRLNWWMEKLKFETLRDISLGEVEKALQEKGRSGVTGKTLTQHAMTLAAFVHWTMKRKYLTVDPLDGLRKFDSSVSPKGRRRALSLDEIGKLLSMVPLPRKLVYRLAIVSGFRAGELKSLRVGSLDLGHRMVFLRAEHAKDRKDASCALPEDLAEALARYTHGRKPEHELFPEFNPNHAGRRFDRDCKAAKIEKRTFGGKVDFHALRTAHVNLGIELGFDVKTAQTLARHKDPNLTLNVYGRANAERLRGAVESLDRALVGAVSRPASAKEVKSGPLALAAGAENLAQGLEAQDDEGEGAALGASLSNPVAPTISLPRENLHPEDDPGRPSTEILKRAEGAPEDPPPSRGGRPIPIRRAKDRSGRIPWALSRLRIPGDLSP